MLGQRARTAEGSTERAPRPTHRILLPLAVVLVGGYLLLGTASLGRGIGGTSSDGSWLDAAGQPTTEPPTDLSLVLSPSPLVALLIVALLGAAWAAREARAPRWVSPAAAGVATLVPVAAFAANWAWIRSFPDDWRVGVPVESPWWAVLTVTVDTLP